MGVEHTDIIIVGIRFPVSDFQAEEYTFKPEWYTYLDNHPISAFNSEFNPDEIYLLYDGMGCKYMIMGYILAKACREDGDHIGDNDGVFKLPSWTEWMFHHGGQLSNLLKLAADNGLISMLHSDQYGIWYICHHT